MLNSLSVSLSMFLSVFLNALKLILHDKSSRKKYADEICKSSGKRRRRKWVARCVYNPFARPYLQYIDEWCERYIRTRNRSLRRLESSSSAAAAAAGAAKETQQPSKIDGRKDEKYNLDPSMMERRDASASAHLNTKYECNSEGLRFRVLVKERDPHTRKHRAKAH